MPILCIRNRSANFKIMGAPKTKTGLMSSYSCKRNSVGPTYGVLVFETKSDAARDFGEVKQFCKGGPWEWVGEPDCITP